MFEQYYDEEKKCLQFALFSENKLHRYVLGRWWADKEMYNLGEMICFLMLNPSTADHTQDDNTIRRCISYAKLWGFKGLIITNIFAYRQTDPNKMKAYFDPIGEDNNKWIRYCADNCKTVVCGWGNHGTFLNRSESIKSMLKHVDLFCLGSTSINQPRHPLYLKKDKELEFWSKRFAS